MRILTVRNPWAWGIIHGGKNVENRVRNIAGQYRGPIAIHVGLRYDYEWRSSALHDAMRPVRNRAPSVRHPWPWEENYGQIIGVVDLVDVHVVQQSSNGGNDCFDDRTPVGDICSPWGQEFDEFPAYRGHHLVLAKPRPLAEPIPFKGALGLRALDAATIARVEAAIEVTT